ncbi:hypothetical protein NAEGRDRAFT_78631 [Naegleria gruberi]|uniref:Uncharacterized protein n=1 Tax=Naegleria gruberi TaxID=5762 RepID=D2V542_NAEGR|nr:uncharacterized protein NAEGRDRAFT_78631 [Naegleria gruberi]EFC48209.1 hypothetical protein NAEGRDRAFT_78631 [Naegleria gruberi]|eukprot:XP_002680953.1 hypothetical protein NAEGRDRAFT_78631 [Naegleria gruberi strain NEG-M]
MSESNSPTPQPNIIPTNTNKLLRQTQKPIGPDDRSTLLVAERAVYETRLNSPIAFNVLIFNLALGSAYVSGVLRKRRNPPQTGKANILTVSSSLLLVFSFMRNLSPSFERKYALDPREDKLSPSGLKRWVEKKKELEEKYKSVSE